MVVTNNTAVIQTSPSADSLQSSGSSRGSMENLGLDEFENGEPPAQPQVVVPLREKIAQKVKAGERWFSLEFFPPKTIAGAANLTNRMEVMNKGQPLFCDITWHPAGNPAGDQPTSSMSIARTMLEYCGIETVLHITCCNLTRDQIHDILLRAKSFGIRSLVALRGDPPLGEEWKPMENGFRYATDLVRYIRQHFGDYFSIAVAGYPIPHPEAESYEEDLKHLKEKVDAGADVIITQLFFESSVMINFVKDCRELGITIPILPGILPIMGYQQIVNLMNKSGLKMPDAIMDAMEPIKDNDAAVRKFGIDQAVSMIKELYNSGVLDGGVHIYTLNREVATIEILKQLGLWNSSHVHRPFPWKTVSRHAKRAAEDVRPIFWAMRPKSYIYRTRTWDEFPNGRWGNSQSPAFGTLTDYHLFYLKSHHKTEELLPMWGPELASEADVFDVFASFITGCKNKHGNKVTHLPWSEGDEIHPETNVISDKLGELNRRGVLTINSQPNINCLPSDDPVHGWGDKGGYVFQKAYLEFFTSAMNAWALRDVLKEYPQVNYHILDHTGQINVSNFHRYRPMAVTWGVFSGKEIVQPTVVDPEAFHVWKQEAFDVWSVYWGQLYPEGSQSRKIVEDIHDNYVLIYLVDNDFPKETVLWEILDKMLVYAATVQLDDVDKLLRSVTEAKKGGKRTIGGTSVSSSLMSFSIQSEDDVMNPTPPVPGEPAPSA